MSENTKPNYKQKNLMNPDGTYKHIYSQGGNRILNPLTGRFMKVNSRVHRDLVRRGILNSNHYTFYDDHVKRENDLISECIKMISNNKNIDIEDKSITTMLLNRVKQKNKIDLSNVNTEQYSAENSKQKGPEETKVRKQRYFKVNDPLTEYETEYDYDYSESDNISIAE